MKDPDPYDAAAQIGRAAAQMRLDEEQATRSRDRWAELITRVDDLGIVPVTTIASWSDTTPLTVRRAITRAYRQRAKSAVVLEPVTSAIRAVDQRTTRVWRQADAPAATSVILAPADPLRNIHS